MPRIIGLIKDSGNAPLSGVLEVRLDAYMLDRSSTPDSLLTTEPRAFPIVNGLLDINLPESETQNQSYFFEFFSEKPVVNYFFTDGSLYSGVVHQHTDGRWYVGDFHETNSRVLIRSESLARVTVFNRRVVIPNVSEIDFVDLLPTGVTSDVLDTSIRRLAQLLTGDLQYVEALRGGPSPKGAWNATTYYHRDDFVTYSGSSWLCLAPLPIVNIPPNSSPTNWACIAEKGEPGGTGGTATPYNATGWQGQPWAPSAGVLRDVIETLARTSALADLAPKNSPVLTGNPSRNASPLSSDRSTQLATTEWAGNLFAPIVSPVFTGNPSVPTQPITDISGKVASTKFVDDYVKGRTFGVLVNVQQSSQLNLVGNSWTKVLFPTEITDSFGLFANGDFTPTNSGLYRFGCGLFFAADAALSIADISLYQIVGGTATRIGVLLYQPISGTSAILTGSVEINLTAGQTYSIRAFTETSSNPRIAIAAGTTTNWLTIERVSLL